MKYTMHKCKHAATWIVIAAMLAALLPVGVMSITTSAAHVMPLHIPEMLKFAYTKSEAETAAGSAEDELRSPKLWELAGPFGNTAWVPQTSSFMTLP